MSPPLISKAAAHYTGAGGKEHCSLCRHFSPRRGGRCARVLGDISPMGWCRLFSREMRGLVADASSFNGGAGGPTLGLDFMAPGVLDPRITFTRASTATYFDSAGVMQTAAVNAPRWDYDPATLALRGLLIEEARTNSTPNSTMAGAVAGTPGTFPTGWGNGGLVAGLSQQIVGVGTQNGISYIDLRCSGTATGAGNMFPTTSGATVSSAASAPWTASSYFALVGGSLTNVPAIFLAVNYTPGGNMGLDIRSALTSNLTRITTSGTTPAGTTGVSHIFLNIGVQAGPVDFTLRWGAPQLEAGAFATSYIPTTSAAVTRALDIATLLTSPWYNATAGSVFVEFINRAWAAVAINNTVSTFDDGAGTRANAIDLVAYSNSSTYMQPNLSILVGSSVAGSVSYGNLNLAGTASTKWAGRWQSAATIAHSCNGVAVTSGVQAAMPPIGRVMLGAGISSLNGYLRQFRYWNRMLTDAELQSMTVL